MFSPLQALDLRVGLLLGGLHAAQLVPLGLLDLLHGPLLGGQQGADAVAGAGHGAAAEGDRRTGRDGRQWTAAPLTASCYRAAIAAISVRSEIAGR